MYIESIERTLSLYIISLILFNDKPEFLSFGITELFCFQVKDE